MVQLIIELYVLLRNGIMQLLQLPLVTIILYIKRGGVLCGQPVHFYLT